jgi:chaperonin cofactor prefoldin
MRYRRLFAAALLCSFVGRIVSAQSPSTPSPSDSGQQNAASTNTSTTAPPKKVWTNDDLPSTKGGISVVGDKRNQKSSPAPAKTADPGTVSRIRQELQKLQAQLDDVNLKLTSFKEFQEGETVTKADGETSYSYTRTPVNQQMSGLQQKKKKLEAQIDALNDEARKKGIEPGQLR